MPAEAVWAAGGFSANLHASLFQTPRHPTSGNAQNVTCPSPHSPSLLPSCNPEQEVERGVKTILAGLGDAKEESEVVIYLLALGNAALPKTIPTLLDHAEEGPTAITTAAISALRQFPARHISSKVRYEAAKAWCSSSHSKPSHWGANRATVCTSPP